MKKLFLFGLLFWFNLNLSSQIVFCPPGTQWNYSIFNSAGGSPLSSYSNEQIKYVRDSTLAFESVKVLSHNRVYLDCDSHSLPNLTLIKQTGDTIFFRNAETNNTWQILYNFNVQAGNTWKTNLSQANYTIVVNAVRTITVNGFTLKKLDVLYKMYKWTTHTYSLTITERFGCSGYLFNYFSSILFGGCDGDWFDKFLCYSDNTFGTKQFTNLACNYSTVGEEKITHKNSELKIYPNPATDQLYFKIPFEERISLQIFDALGKQILWNENYKGLEAIDMKGFDKGLYFYRVKTKDNFYSGKFLKE